MKGQAEVVRRQEPPGAHDLAAQLRAKGFAHVDVHLMRALLGEAAARWADFSSHWDDLGLDRFMADGGLYRRRRHAVFRTGGGELVRQPPQPHYQSRAYNPLNGGVERWFEPLLAPTAEHPVFLRLLELAQGVFAAADPGSRPSWRTEVHQFRIETVDGVGRPTPEGRHRDGVDWVLVVLVDRRNALGGLTEIRAADGTRLERILLKEPGDAVLLDDRRVLHDVTPIQPVNPLTPARRDTLVATFAAV